MFSFTRRLPFFSKKLSAGMWQLYGFDALLFVIYAGVIFAVGPDFLAFSSTAPLISVSVHDFRILGVFGVYAVRISTIVAIARRNRQPQVIEWWVTIIGLSFAAFMLVFGGFMEVPYANLHGFEYCATANGIDVFVKRALPCPAQPAP